MDRHQRTLWDNFWKDERGRTIVWQSPNLPLWVWIISTILSKTLPYGQLNFAAALISFGSLFTWAWLELFQGDNYFRRVLGAIVLAAAILSRLN
jgi:hypothetical protein